MTMSKIGSIPDFGPPDPELRNSPIFDDSDRDDLDLDVELEEGVCYFNNQTFKIGAYVCSGNELLRCEMRGVWVREGSCQEE
jgi:hypothetical protein